MAMEANKTRENKQTIDRNVSNSIRFSTQYNTKAFDIQRVIQKNWNILKLDPILNLVLPSKPDVQSVCCRSVSLRCCSQKYNKKWPTLQSSFNLQPIQVLVYCPDTSPFLPNTWSLYLECFGNNWGHRNRKGNVGLWFWCVFVHTFDFLLNF